MSIEAINAVRFSGITPSGRKFVALALADHADEAFECFPHVDTLAAYTAQSEKTVRDHLKALEADGIISRVRTRRDDGTLAGYRFRLHRQNLPVAKSASGEKRHSPPAKTTGQEPPNLTTNTTTGRARVSADQPIPEDWTPRQAEIAIGLDELGMTETEIEDAASEFVAYWRGQSGRKAGRKSDWDITFRNRLREIAKRWGTRHRRASGSGGAGGQRSGGASLADIAARMRTHTGD